MHPIICSILGLAGTSTVLYVMGGTFLTCIKDVARRDRQVLTTHWSESHTAIMLQYDAMMVDVEELNETVVETIGPFIGS